MTRVSKAHKGRRWYNGCCAPTCASALLRHHGFDVSIAQCAEEAKTCVGGKGTIVPNIALLFLRRGLDVRLDCWDPWFRGRLQELEGDELLEASQRAFRKLHWVRGMQEFKELGGTFRARHASMSDVVAAVGADEPPIVVVDAAHLDATDKTVSSHAVIPIELDRKQVTVLDPGSWRPWAQWVYPREDFEASFRWMGSQAIFVSKK